MLTKQEILLGKGPRVESSRVRKPRRTALPRGSQYTGGVSFKPFPNSSGWWRLISSLFLTRTAYREITHADSYYGAWPGWVVSIRVLPLTLGVQRSGLQPLPCELGWTSHVDLFGCRMQLDNTRHGE